MKIAQATCFLAFVLCTAAQDLLQRELVVGPDVKVNYSLVDSTNIRLAIDIPVDGWAAFGVGAGMSDSDVVIGGGTKAGGQADVVWEYHITDYSSDGISREQGLENQLSQVEVRRIAGRTQVLFTRPLNNGLSQIVLEQSTPVVWAYGSGDTIQYHASNRGSTTVTFSNNASLSATTTLQLPSAESGSLPQYGLQSVIDVGAGVRLHYGNMEDRNTLRLGIDVPALGWAALAVGSSMANGDAVIGGGLKGGGVSTDVLAYMLTSTQGDGSGVQENLDATARLADAVVVQDNGRTIVIFTRPLDNGVTSITTDADTYLMWAYGTGTTIRYHGANRRVLRVNFLKGSAAEDDSAKTHKLIHGALMLTSWGLMIPMGTLAAAWGGTRFQKGGPRAFKFHRAAQSFGLLVSIGGVVYAMRYVYSGAISMTMPLHGLVGLGVTGLGIFQPLNAIMRPHGDSLLRSGWELIHKNSGRLATVAGLLNCIFGAFVARQQSGEVGMSVGTNAPFGILFVVSLALCALFAAAYVAGKCWSRRRDPEATAEIENHTSFHPVVRPDGRGEQPIGAGDEEMPRETTLRLEEIVAMYASHNSHSRIENVKPQSNDTRPEKQSQEEHRSPACMIL